MLQIVIVKNERGGCPCCVLQQGTNQGRERDMGPAVTIVIIKRGKLIEACGNKQSFPSIGGDILTPALASVSRAIVVSINNKDQQKRGLHPAAFP